MTAHTSGVAERDLHFLERARLLGREGWGRVHPNPLVGCVLVRDGEVVAEGCHEVFGGPHAEIVALERARTAAEGATAYVSLEPCNHHGKTPPCSEALLKAGVSRVVYGAADPGEESGGGGAHLAAAGVEVVGPVFDERTAVAENPAFFHTRRASSPFVALKLAVSLDARIAAEPGVRTRLTGAEAEREVHRLRAGFDAVLVGEGTLRADDPRLTVRLVPHGAARPKRVVLLSDPDLPDGLALFEDAGDAMVHLFVPEEASEAAMERLEERGAHVHPVPVRDGGVDPAAVLSRLWDLGVGSVLCEGGAEVAATLLRCGRVHRLYLFVAPTTLGEGGVAAFPPDADRLDWSDFEPTLPPERFGRDTLLVLDRGA